MEDMGNLAGNSRLPDVLCNFAFRYNLSFPFYRPAQKVCFIYPGLFLVIFAKFFRATSLDINNSIALILLYFGPTALNDGLRIHPVTMEDNSSLTSLGGQVPGVFLILILLIISLFIPQYNAPASTLSDASAMSCGDHANTAVNTHLYETFV